MILKNDQPFDLDPKKVKHLKETIFSKGHCEVRMHESLSYTERVADEKMRFYSRTTSPPSIEVEAKVVKHTDQGTVAYQYVETRIPVKNGFRNLPSGIEVREAGRTIKNIELAYFLYYFCGHVEGGEACEKAKSSNPNHRPLLKFYDENWEAKKEISAAKLESKVRYLITNEWDERKLADACRKMFISVSEDASVEKLQKELLGHLSMDTSPNKYQVFLNKVDAQEASISADTIHLYIEQGIFARAGKAWMLHTDKGSVKLFDLRPVQLGAPIRALHEYCLNFPDVVGKANVQYKNALAQNKSEIKSSVDSINQEERFDISPDEDDDSISEDQAMEMVENIGKAIALDVVVKQGRTHKFKTKSLGKDQEAIFDRLVKNPDIYQDILKALSEAESGAE